MIHVGGKESFAQVVEGAAVEHDEQRFTERGDISGRLAMEEVAGGVHGFGNPVIEFGIVDHRLKAKESGDVHLDAEPVGRGSGSPAGNLGAGNIFLGEPTKEGGALNGIEARGKGFGPETPTPNSGRNEVAEAEHIGSLRLIRSGRKIITRIFLQCFRGRFLLVVIGGEQVGLKNNVLTNVF